MRWQFALEHLNFLCIGLGRREDFVQQGRKRRQCYSLPSISNAVGKSRNRHKPYTKNLISKTTSFNTNWPIGQFVKSERT